MEESHGMNERHKTLYCFPITLKTIQVPFCVLPRPFILWHLTTSLELISCPLSLCSNYSGLFLSRTHQVYFQL